MNDDQVPPSVRPKRFFDIVPARKTMPDATSRPIIVSQGSDVNDPMMVGKESGAARPPEIAALPALPIEVKRPLTPSESDELGKGAPPPEPIQPIEPESPPEPEAPRPVPDTNEPMASLQLPAEPPDGADNSLSMPTLELPTGAQGVVVSRHHPANQRITITLIILIVVLAIVIVDLVLDTGLLKTSLPHTHLFGS